MKKNIKYLVQPIQYDTLTQYVGSITHPEISTPRTLMSTTVDILCFC